MAEGLARGLLCWVSLGVVFDVFDDPNMDI